MLGADQRQAAVVALGPQRLGGPQPGQRGARRPRRRDSTGVTLDADPPPAEGGASGRNRSAFAEGGDHRRRDQGDHDDRCHHSGSVDHPGDHDASVPAGCSRTRTPRASCQRFSPTSLRLLDDPARAGCGRAVAEGDADAGPGGGDLGHGVLPVVLDGPAHDEEIALAEEERQRRAATPGPQQERAGARPTLTMTTSGSACVVAHPVAVPRHAVATVAVEVQARRCRTGGRSAGATHVGHLGQHRQRQRRAAVGLGPPPGEPGLVDHPVVHGHPALAPRRAGDQLGEHLVRPGQPPGQRARPTRCRRGGGARARRRSGRRSVGRGRTRRPATPPPTAAHSRRRRRPGRRGLGRVGDVVRTCVRSWSRRRGPPSRGLRGCPGGPVHHRRRSGRPPPASPTSGLTDAAHRRRLERGHRHVRGRRGDRHPPGRCARPTRCVSVLVTPAKADGAGADLEPLDVEVFVADRTVMRRRHRASTSTGARWPSPGACRCRPSIALAAGARTIAVLEGINDHENLGAIARSAVALGVDGLLLDPTCADPLYRRCVRVSMGEILHLPFTRGRRLAREPSTALRRRGVRRRGPDPGDRMPRRSTTWPPRWPARPVALVLGAEGPGLADRHWRRPTTGPGYRCGRAPTRSTWGTPPPSPSTRSAGSRIAD